MAEKANEKETAGGKKKKASAGKMLKEGALSFASVLVGAWAGATVGRHSLVPGLAIAGAGIYMKESTDKKELGHYTTLFGLGMTVGTSEPKTPSTVSGFDGFLEDATARAKEFGRSMLKKTYADKIPAVAKAVGLEETTVSGLGEAKYFTADGREISMEEADRIIKQMAAANPGTGMRGLAGDLSKDFPSTSKSIVSPSLAGYSY